MLYWTHSTVYIDYTAWSMDRNQNKVHILLYCAAHGVSHQEAQVWSTASLQNTQPDHGQRSSEVLTLCEYKCPAQPMKRYQVWSILHPTVCSVPMQPDHGDRSSGNGKRFSLANLIATIFKVVAENFSSIYTGVSLEATERKIMHVWCTGFHCVQAECPARRMFTPPGWVQSDTYRDQVLFAVCGRSAHAAWPMKTDQDQVWMEKDSNLKKISR